MRALCNAWRGALGDHEREEKYHAWTMFDKGVS